MNIPEDSEFKELIKLLTKEIRFDREQIQNIPLTRETVTKALLTVLDTWDTNIAEIRASKAFHWYQNESCFSRVEKRRKPIRNEGDKIDNQTIACSIANSYFESISKKPDRTELDRNRYLKAKVTNFGPPSRFDYWLADVLEAFRNYFYGERYKKLYDEYNSRKTLVREAVHAISVLKRCESFEHYPLHTQANWPRIEQEIALLSDMSIDDLYPARRMDPSIKERVLVHDLYHANISYCGKPKVSWVDELLALDGIEHPLDRRTVERMISRFEGARCEADNKWYK